MRVGYPPVDHTSSLTVDADLDFNGVYQVKALAAPAATEALRKGSKDITNAEVSDSAALARSKLDFGAGLVDNDVATTNKDGAAATPSLRTLGTAATQAAAGNHTHTLSDDITGSAVSAIALAGSSGTGSSSYINLTTGQEVDLAAKTLIYAANSTTLAVGVYYGYNAATNSFKLRLYMGGVQVAESGYLPIDDTINIIKGTKSLVGSNECKLSVKNYNAGTQSLYWYDYSATHPLTAAIIAGSVKL